MTEHEASGLVGHQDYGTGLSDDSRDPTAAAFFAGGDAATAPHVISGLDISADAETISIDPGAALIHYDGVITVPDAPTDDPAAYSTTWNGPIAFPVSVDAFSVTPSTTGEYHVHLVIDPANSNAVSYALSTDSTQVPTHPSLKIGVVNTDTGVIDELNRTVSTPHAETAGDADTVDGLHASELGADSTQDADSLKWITPQYRNLAAKFSSSDGDYADTDGDTSTRVWLDEQTRKYISPYPIERIRIYSNDTTGNSSLALNTPAETITNIDTPQGWDTIDLSNHVDANGRSFAGITQFEIYGNAYGGGIYEIEIEVREVPTHSHSI